MFANVDGISNKVGEFSSFVNKEDPFLICLVETKLNSETNNLEVFDTGRYEVYRKDRGVQNAPGGGVAILIKKTLLSTNENVKFLNDHRYEEATWCEICLQGKKILVGAIYRAPSSPRDVNNLLCDLVRLSDNYDRESQVLICGDFNFGEVCWETNSVTVDGQHVVDARNFLDVTNDCFLYQHIGEVTHNIDYDNPSRLDLVFTRNEHDVENITLFPPLGKSHHATVLFDFKMDGDPKQEEEEETYKFSFHKGNYTEIRRLLSEIDWYTVFEDKPVEEMYEVFVKILMDLINKYVPKVRCTTGKVKPKWMTREVREQITVKERAWNRLKARKTPLRAEEYRRARNRATTMVKMAKREFDKKLCEDIKANPKHFWSYMRSKTNLKENVMRVKKRNDVMTENDEETANEFNRAFQSVYVNEDRQEVPDFDINYNGPLIKDVEVTVGMVKNLLKQTNVHKAMGPDDIHPKLLQECHKELALPIALIIKKSINTGSIPSLWKVAKLCPIYKKGIKTDPLNYRPVSLTCVICKICEIIIRNELVEHLESNNLISNEQHGFRRNRSTLTNLLVYMEHLTKAVDQQIPVDINYLDCKKAFDTVPHKRLLVKLSAYGVRGKTLAWIEEFLSNRQQTVEIRGKKSGSLPITSGVPQGSVLGPILFLVFVNDLASSLECPTLLFADDAKIFVKINSDEDIQAMRRDLQRLQEWSRKWLLEFNADKCVTMHVGHRNPEIKYELGGRELRTTEIEKDLGVHISKDLKPAQHIGKITAKANRMVGLIRRTFSYMDNDMCKSLYCSLVRPHLEYAVQSWSPYYRKDIDEIEKVQRRATKLSPDLKDLPYEERCRLLGLTTLEKRRLRGDLIETYKILTGKENINHEVFFELRDSNTRSNTVKLIKSGHWRTLVRANTFSVRVVNIWNSLPEDVVTAPSIGSFKARLDKSVWSTA